MTLVIRGDCPSSVNIDARSLNIAASSIKIIPEARNHGETFDLMTQWFQGSKQICFLGFGFDELNISSLD